MTKFATVGAACLAIALAATSPVMARGGGHGGGGGRGGFHGGGFGGGGARFAGGGFRGGGFGGGFRRGGYGPGIAAGLIAGSVLGGGYGYYGYGPGYYDDSYAYDQGPVAAVDDSYCAQRYQSYDPASGTYLGYDGRRHPCQ